MKPLYTQDEFENAKSKNLLSCECYYCNNLFSVPKSRIIDSLNPNSHIKVMYCSNTCRAFGRNPKQSVLCTNCDKEFLKKPSQIRSNNNFCSRSCAVTYNNKNKTHGTRRSKLEIYIEEQLSSKYPKLVIEFNQKSAIGSELDIYIPSLNLAFELNGIFHYEPIYGTNKLDQIQNNDISKSKACHDAKIDLCIIDTSAQINFKISTSQKYLDIIINIINERL